MTKNSKWSDILLDIIVVKAPFSGYPPW